MTLEDSPQENYTTWQWTDVDVSIPVAAPIDEIPIDAYPEIPLVKLERYMPTPDVNSASS